MAKKIIVLRCDNCPFMKRVGSRECRYTGFLSPHVVASKIPDDLLTIPEWCPLLDHNADQDDFAPVSLEHLQRYIQLFRRSIHAGFGMRPVCSTIYQTTDEFSVRLIAIHLNCSEMEECKIIHLSSEGIVQQLRTIGIDSDVDSPIKIYKSINYKNQRIPTVHVIKPNQTLYWTDSEARYDVGEVVSDIMSYKKQR